jgi:hypothetical protein
MSLLYGDNFINQVSLTGESKTFALLFDNCSTIKNAENLILPAMILTNSCYYLMFRGCTNLITAPKLPAIELTERCY